MLADDSPAKPRCAETRAATSSTRGAAAAGMTSAACPYVCGLGARACAPRYGHVCGVCELRTRGACAFALGWSRARECAWTTQQAATTRHGNSNCETGTAMISRCESCAQVSFKACRAICDAHAARASGWHTTNDNRVLLWSRSQPKWELFTIATHALLLGIPEP